MLIGLPPPSIDPSHHYAFHGTAINPDTGTIADRREVIKCTDGKQWTESNREEIGYLFQGLGPTSKMPTGADTLFFIHRNQVPKNKKATYILVLCAERPEKTQPRRVRWTMGGDRIVYTSNVSTKTANLTTAKLMFDSVISTPKACFMVGDLKDFYLGTKMEEYEYACIPLYLIPPLIISRYDLKAKIVDGHVYAECRKGMYAG
jgi:hypothetical protein